MSPRKCSVRASCVVPAGRRFWGEMRRRKGFAVAAAPDAGEEGVAFFPAPAAGVVKAVLGVAGECAVGVGEGEAAALEEEEVEEEEEDDDDDEVETADT